MMSDGIVSKTMLYLKKKKKKAFFMKKRWVILQK